MRRLTRGFRKGEKGFTLIELLVVIAILGIIAAIVVPNFGSFFGRGQTEACNIEERMVTTIAIAYASEEGVCPTTLSQLYPYFEGVDSDDDLQGTYTLTGTHPNCVVTQTVCPTPAP